MKFTPKSDKEIAEENLWPRNEYDFEIIEGEDAISKVKSDGSGGNEMIVLKVKVYNVAGGFKLVDDYLLESISYKLRHAAEACGLLGKYESGELHGADFTGKAGRLKLVIQKSKDDRYADKNVIQDYLKLGEETSAHVTAKANGYVPQPELNDEIPF